MGSVFLFFYFSVKSLFSLSFWRMSCAEYQILCYQVFPPPPYSTLNMTAHCFLVCVFADIKSVVSLIFGLLHKCHSSWVPCSFLSFTLYRCFLEILSYISAWYYYVLLSFESVDLWFLYFWVFQPLILQIQFFSYPSLFSPPGTPIIHMLDCTVHPVGHCIFLPMVHFDIFYCCVFIPLDLLSCLIRY